MSNKFRNPFKLRASEKIESEVGFLRLFSPHVLEALSNEYQSGKLWENILLIHSSPGGGKSSLLRAFEPASLITLLNNKSATEYRALFNALKKIEVINNEKVKLLGVSLQCTRNYQILEELNISEAQKKRLFFSLFNSRIMIATLRSACKLKGKKFPEDLQEFSFEYNNEGNFFKSIGLPCTGKDLYIWASNIEKEIYRLVDSFLPIKDITVEGHDELISILAVRPENLTLNGEKICSRILFMFDDAHKLSISQRKIFKQYLLEKRSDCNVWISERLEALEAKDHLGSFNERDFQILNLENFWKKYPAKLSKILQNISDKRASISTEEVTSFQEYLTENINEENIKEKLKLIISQTQEKLDNTAKYTNKFDEWLNYSYAFEGSLLEKAVLLKELEILINRNIGKSQLSLEFPMDVNELHNKNNADVTNAAYLFMSIEYEIPYYFSFKTLSKLSSYNIEQFLSFGAEMFEEMISNKMKGDEIMLSDSKQNKIIENVAKKKWKRIDMEVPYAKDIQKFLKSLGNFSKKQTFQPNAPYAPGVSGFSIKPKKQNLFKESYWIDNPIYEPLIDVISTCVAYNLLEKHTVLQGKKGQVWDVYYMNRWLCVFFGLPLSHGGFRHKTPDELIKWIK
jgi:hypothetical protein|tara:strand:+ start:33240 stop:35123 length:1884 start_codon:yes stop_codon:yes gene_type:complete